MRRALTLTAYAALYAITAAALVAAVTIAAIAVAATSAAAAVQPAAACLTLKTPQVKTLPGNARYLQISGRQDCTPGWEYNAVTITDSHGDQMTPTGFSTVLPTADGKYAHGEYFLPVPRTATTWTITAEAHTGDGLAATTSRTITVKPLPAVSTTLNKPTTVVRKGETFLQVSGTTTGYGQGAVSTVTVVDTATGETTANGESGVKTDGSGKFRHGQVFFPVTPGHTYKVTATTSNNIPETSTATVTVTV